MFQIASFIATMIIIFSEQLDLDIFYDIYLILLSSSIYFIQIYISIAHVTCCANEDRIKIIKEQEKAIIAIILNFFFPGSGSLMLGLSKFCNEDKDNRIRRINKCIWKNLKYLLSGLFQITGFIIFLILFEIHIIISLIIGSICFCFSIYSGIKNIIETCSYPDY